MREKVKKLHKSNATWFNVRLKATTTAVSV